MIIIITKAVLGLLLFWVFVVLAILFAPAEFVYVQLGSKICRLMGISSVYDWTITPFFFKAASDYHDWFS